MQTVPLFRDGKTYTSNSKSLRPDDSNDTKWAPIKSQRASMALIVITKWDDKNI